jgi:hypothetical protein
MHPLSKKLRSHYVPFEFIPFKSHHSRVSLFPGVLNVTKTWGHSFSRVPPFHEWAVSDLERSMNRSLWVYVTHSSFMRGHTQLQKRPQNSDPIARLNRTFLNFILSLVMVKAVHSATTTKWWPLAPRDRKWQSFITWHSPRSWT